MYTCTYTASTKANATMRSDVVFAHVSLLCMHVKHYRLRHVLHVTHLLRTLQIASSTLIALPSCALVCMNIVCFSAVDIAVWCV